MPHLLDLENLERHVKKAVQKLCCAINYTLLKKICGRDRTPSGVTGTSCIFQLLAMSHIEFSRVV